MKKQSTVTENAKKVRTFDHAGKENGWLMELFKDAETGVKTEVYLTAAFPGAFKGYHLHRVREARYVCLKGKMRITTFMHDGSEWVRSESILDEKEPRRMYIPKNVATGLENIGEGESWLVNYPSPAYDPGLKDEQVEYSLEELHRGVVK
jgi:dTDP-4-dehydrorhamnose 3,5-epimerase-like enzyme